MKTRFSQFILEQDDPFLDLDPKIAYHDSLNPAIWDNFELLPDVKEALDKIAAEFITFLDIDSSVITDVILTGSNANYNWTDVSDLDLHVIFDFGTGIENPCPSCPSSDFISDCFDSKKTLWNTLHHITIHGFSVELYAQDKNDQLTSDAGVYSLYNSKWIVKPEHQEVSLDNKLVLMKAEDLMKQIDELVDSKTDDEAALTAIKDRIKKLRSAGLKKEGELSIENLAFKALRNLGYIAKLYNYIADLRDRDLSI
jgi:hypothetical protein